ncbi:MAG: PilZ domain-containing protein [Nitrospiraceae bacterium]
MSKRISARVKVNRPITVHSIRGISQGTLLDLCPNGGRIGQTGANVHSGMRVTLSILLPDSTEPVEIRHAVVSWTTLHEFGVQFFSKTSPDMLKRINQVYQLLLEAQTGREPNVSFPCPGLLEALTGPTGPLHQPSTSRCPLTTPRTAGRNRSACRSRADLQFTVG